MSNAESPTKKSESPLIRVLRKWGLLSKEQVAEVVEAHERAPIDSTGAFLIENGYASKEQIERAKMHVNGSNGTNGHAMHTVLTRLKEATSSTTDTITTSVELRDIAEAIRRKAR